MYNDQPPQGPTTASGGHTKGVILTNLQGGIWLQHSVPHFPEYRSGSNYSYPKTGENNGQVLHCLSLDVNEVDNIGNILAITKPHVYNFSIPEGLQKSLPTLMKVVGKKNAGQELTIVQFGDERNHVHAGDSYHKYETVSETMSRDNAEADENFKLVPIKNGGRILSAFAKGPSFNEGESVFMQLNILHEIPA